MSYQLSNLNFSVEAFAQARCGKIMQVTPEMESFFVAINLAHGTSPVPKFGMERAKLGDELTRFIKGHPGQPEAMRLIKRNYAELGGRRYLAEEDPLWFYRKMADAYLSWLYSQDVSKQFLVDHLASLPDKDREDTLELYGPHIGNKRSWIWK